MNADQDPHALPLRLRIAQIDTVARGIYSFELVSADGGELPPFTPGAHLRLRVPSGLERKFSLCNDAAERRRYVVTVKRDAGGHGGSVSLCDQSRVGDLLAAAPPDNAFPLAEGARSHLFIAGGIGITPFLSMIRSFGELPPAPWKLVYLSRTPEDTACLDELSAPHLKSRVKIHHSQGDPSRAFDLWPLLERPSGAHVYCCGPRRLMDAVRDMTGHWPARNVHFESFVEGGEARPDDQPFHVRLARSGQVFEVPVGQSLLNVLRAQGCHLPSSCESGTCGTCRTTLLAGEADHRDLVLGPDEHTSQIMVCVSRARSAELTIDL